MESVGSNSPPLEDRRQRSNPRSSRSPIQGFNDRIVRALRHRLRLLHRSDTNFYILGATGNVYIVTLTSTPTCTCPDRATPCKHILFILIRVLGVHPDDSCLRRRNLQLCRLTHLLSIPTLPEALATPGLCERFHQLFFQTSRRGGGELKPTMIEIEDGTVCPVCLDDMVQDDDKVAVCGTCRNPIHEKCLMSWKRSRGRRSASCVICRARWINRRDQDKYLNLAAYVREDDFDESRRRRIFHED